MCTPSQTRPTKPDRPNPTASNPTASRFPRPRLLSGMTTRDPEMDEAVAGATERASEHFRKMIEKEREHTAALQENIDANDFQMT
jgi:hypothetical protein